MRYPALMAITLTLFGTAPAFADGMVITPNDARPTINGAAETFTGAVLVDPLYSTNDRTSSTGAYVTFAPNARSAWHTHPAGQVLIVTDGVGWVQEEGGEKRELRSGDVVWTPPGVKHWHGGTEPPPCGTSPSRTC